MTSPPSLFPVQSTTIGRRTQRPGTEIGSSRYGRCGAFSIEFCSLYLGFPFALQPMRNASREARLLTEAPEMPLDEMRLMLEQWGNITGEPRGVDSMPIATIPTASTLRAP
jgi:hypothetical protein